MDLYGQRLSGDGQLVGGNLLLVDTSGQDVQELALTGNEAGQFFLTWSQIRSSSDYDVLGLRVTAATGAVEGSTIDFGTGGSKDRDPTVTAVTTETYQVGWTENGYKLYIRQVGSDGALAGSSGTEIGQGYEPSLIPAGGGSLIVWEDTTLAGETLIGGHLIDAGGATSGSLLTLSPYYSLREYAALAYEGQSGRYLLAWQQAAGAAQTDIFLQGIDAQGRAISSPLNLTTEGTVAQGRAAVAAGSGAYLVVWEDSRNQGTTGVDLYAQQIDQNRLAIGKPLQHHHRDR